MTASWFPAAYWSNDRNRMSKGGTIAAVATSADLCDIVDISTLSPSPAKIRPV
ncbi:hypothetical protein AB0M80_21135 [Amycolatopsis sp. NPDC051045]|uniref:hypothetical protein n=1 Tax=Amycolatopsis sp. NPDC051045 TaxID=3156922 RepID=UPI00341D1965